MANYNIILDKVMKDIGPENSFKKDIGNFIEEINKSLKKRNLKAVCVPGGSVAKGTFLKGDFDVDLFVKFDYKYLTENLSDLLETALPKGYERVHGSRDYFKIKLRKLSYEIVPVLNIKKPELAKNVTDMSPFHVDWVKNRLKKGQADEIRLAKKFCKSIGVYGAESYINGFSGHVLDIIVIYYGSFLSLLKKSKEWTPKVVIDPEKHYKKSREALFSLNQSKIAGPIVVVDPLLKSRNAASALSYETFSLFKKKAAEFLKKPSENFFIEKIMGKDELRKKFKRNLYIITVKPQMGKEDVVGSKILKSFEFLKSGLNKRGFGIIDSGWEWDKKASAMFWFVLKTAELPAKKIAEGPPLEMEEHVKNFKKKYKKCFTKNKRMFSEIKIKLRKPEENIKDLAGEDYFKDWVKIVDVEKC